MITVSQSYRDSLAQNRRFDAVVNIVLNDDTVLRTLHNSDLRAFSIDNAVSEDNKFTMLGSVIINQLSLTIDNRSGEFSHRDFNAAEITCSLSHTLPNNTTETISKGIFYVNEDTYQDGIIKLKCLDNMVRFEKDYADSELTYPASLYEIVDDACTVCGVTLATTTFPHSSFVINSKPTKETSFREVLSWVAQIAGCYATCNQNGELEIKWCDQTLLANLVTAIRLNTDIPSGVYTLPSPYSISAATDDTVLTGVSIEYEYDSVDQEGAETHEIETVMAGNVGFVVALSNNQFITNENADDIVEWLGQQLIGLRFRKVNATHLGDPTLETGDIAVAIDRKGNKYPMIVTRTTFGINARQKTVCGSETPSKNSSVRYSEIARIYTQLQQRIDKLPTNYSVANAIEHATELITGAFGGYLTFNYDVNGNPYEMLIMSSNDRESMQTSGNVLRLNLNGIGFSNSGIVGPYDTAWTLDGRFVADFITTGTLSSILIKSTTTDYWNLSNSDIIDGNNTYYANTLSTRHLIAENDIQITGNPGSFFKIPTKDSQGTTLGYFEVSNANGVNIFCDYSTYGAGGTLTTYFPTEVNPGYHGLPILSGSFNVTDFDAYENYKRYNEAIGYVFLETNGILFSHGYYQLDAEYLNYGIRYISDDHPNHALGPVFELNALNRTVEIGKSDTSAWSLSLNGNNITPIAEAYPNASGHHGAPAVRVESGMATYMSFGVNASSKVLYVYASDNKNSLNYVGRVQLV